MVILLRRRCRLGGSSLVILGRIFLATMVMAIFLVALGSFDSGLRYSIPAALWLAGLVIFGGITFLASAALFGAMPPGLVRRWRH